MAAGGNTPAPPGVPTFVRATPAWASRLAGAALVLGLAACNPLASGPRPADADLSASARDRAAAWDRLLERLAGRPDAYVDAERGEVSGAPAGVLELARTLGVESLAYLERGGARKLEARTWCTGLSTGGSCKGLLFRSGEGLSPTVPVASCDGRAPWKGCPEHATCVVEIPSRPGWFVFCDYDL